MCVTKHDSVLVLFQVVMVVREVIICSASQGLPSIATLEPSSLLFHSISLSFLLPTLNSLSDASHAPLFPLIPSTMLLFFTQIDLLSPLSFCPSFLEESSFFTCTKTSNRSSCCSKLYFLEEVVVWFRFSFVLDFSPVKSQFYFSVSSFPTDTIGNKL